MPTSNILSSMHDGIVVMSSGLMTSLAKAVVKRLRDASLPIEFQELEVRQFNNGETHVELNENVRGKTVFLFHGFSHQPNEDFMRLCIICDAIMCSHAQSIIIISPFFPYGRQDRVQAREPFSAKMVGQMLAINPVIKQMITFDLHSPQIAGYFGHIRVENIPGHALFAPFIRERFADQLSDMTIVSTDAGGAKRARDLADKLDLNVAIVDKRRDRSGSEALAFVGDVKKHALLYDDIGDTLGSLINAMKMAKREGAETACGFVTHGLNSPKSGTTAEEKLRESKLMLYTSDSFPRASEYFEQHPYVIQIASDGLMADIIKALITVNGSIKSTVVRWTARTPLIEGDSE
jgi:ribose-phosphate pyrophosphokinase